MSLTIRRLVKTSSVAVVATILVAPTSVSAGNDWYSDPGTLGTANGWASTLSFTDPAAVASFTVTNAGYYASLGDSTCMTTDPCGWWSVDNASGTNGEGTASLSNSEAAYVPSSVKDYEGVTWTWRSTLCGSFPTVASPLVSCPDVATVTIDFDVPVTNAIVHINNLGGNGSYPSYAEREGNGYTTGYDFTLFSQWQLTSGQPLIQLSGSETTNITLVGDTIRNRFTPQGLGARVSNRESAFDDPSTFYDNGTGSGSFLVPGTYQQLTFQIDLKWALVNYASNTPSSSDIPEGVSVQLSFYDGPISDPDVYDDYRLPSVETEVEALPNTGLNALATSTVA
ncbi:MAG: hypothetical protein ACKOI2_00415 [Actinomycetota bacterium]